MEACKTRVPTLPGALVNKEGARYVRMWEVLLRVHVVHVNIKSCVVICYAL